MNFRGKKVKFIYTHFAQDLAKDAGRYLPQQPQKLTARTADVHSMNSNKIPITMRADTARSQFNASKPATLCAVGDPEDFGDTFDAACMESLEATTTRQEDSTNKRSGNAYQDTSRTSCPRRHMDDRPHSPRPSKTPGTFSLGAPPSGSRGRASTGRGKAMPKVELPPEAPKPDASESAIKQFILDNSVCFYLARGQRCPTIGAQGYCPYSHARQPVPWGAYARAQRGSSSGQTQHDVMALEEDDAPTVDEPSEAEPLSFN